MSKLFVGILAILNKVGRNFDAGDELPDDVQMPLSGIAFDPEKINTRRPSGEHGAGTSRPLDQLRRTRFSRSFKTISYSFELGPCFSNDSALCITWSKYWSFSFSFSRSNEYSGLISFRIDRLDLLAGKYAPIKTNVKNTLCT